MDARLSRLKALQTATKEYVQKERRRLTNEAAVLEQVLKGRTGGKAIQSASTKIATASALEDLDAYIRGP